MPRLFLPLTVALLYWFSSTALALPASDIAAQVKPPLLAIYEVRQFAPLWLDDGKPSARAAQAIEIMSHAADDGLNVDDYKLPALQQMFDSLKAQSTDQQQAAFDLLMSRVSILIRSKSSNIIIFINQKCDNASITIENLKIDIILPSIIRKYIILEYI